jgi:hypothetical protein
MLNRQATGARVLIGVGLVAAAVGCGGHSNSVGSLQVTNDTTSSVTITDCGGGGGHGCVALAHHQLRPEESTSFPLAPNDGFGTSLVIRGDGPKRCFPVPGAVDGHTFFSMKVTNASAMSCWAQDRVSF